MRTSLLLTTALVSLASAAPALAQTRPVSNPVEDPVTLDPITVLATRTATRVDETPATVTVITAREIEQNLYTDIKDLVRFEPGVSVRTQPARFGAALGSTGRDGNAGFTIRGLGGDRVLIVVDGVRTPDGYAFGPQSVGRGGYSDLDLMKSVEILRGPASALYGSDGVAGAVSFTTKAPVDMLGASRNWTARARVAYGSADESVATGLSFAGRDGDLSGLVAWTHRDASETDNQGTVGGEGATRTEPNPQDFSSDALLAKLVWDVAPDHRLGLTWESYNSDVDANVLSGRSASVLDLRAEDETTRQRIGLDWRTQALPGLDEASLAVYRQESETRQFTFEDREPAADRTRDNTFDNDVMGLAAQGRRSLTSGSVEHRLIFGGDWSETTQSGVRDGTVPPFGETFPSSPFPETDYTLSGLFIQDEIVLAGGSLRITPALRYDAYELTTADDPLFTGAKADQEDSRLSPKLGVVWWANDNFGLFASYAEGFKAPTPSQVNSAFGNLVFGYISAPNPDLTPETSRSLEAGLRLREVPVWGGRMALQAVAFQADYEDFISQEVVSGAFTPTDPAVFQYVNFTDVEVKGLEFRSDASWDNGLSARVSAAWAEGDQTTAGTTTALPSIDPLKIVAGMGWDAPSGAFGGQAIVTWSDAKDAADTTGLACSPNCYVGDDFTLFDLTGYWNVTETVTARVGVFNVFDETYGWWSDVSGLSTTSTVLDAYTQPGRNVSVSLTLRL
ncbi:MAG: TonB-dependent hemoglobin/transferrin/lactoferrin family receptor [Brevundimonas sp.]|uniref:TonB-dependent hemoglobin/transferrin/lactoferrin family receptor n=1 Tax=Brevundimonas sp. TaxID=1871086 RepID=UPI003001A243